MRMMIHWRLIRSAALAMLLLAGSGTWSGAEEKAEKAAATPGADAGAGKPKKSKGAHPDRPTESDSDADAAAQSTQGLGGFGRVLPVGEKNLDVKIPSFKDGIPSSTVRAAAMTRLDEENM